MHRTLPLPGPSSPARRGPRRRLAGAVLAAALLVSGATAALAATGDPHLDPTWSGDGIAGLTGNRYGVALSPQDSGRLYVASWNEADAGALRMTRYEANGALATSFGGGDGVVQRRFAPGTNAISFPDQIVRGGDKFVVVGDHWDGVRERLGIMRTSTLGAYDTSFSGDGRVLYRIFPQEHDLLRTWKVQVLNGGKIGLAVAAFDFDGVDDYQFVAQAFVRLNANGTLDTTFHGDGVAVVDLATSDVTWNPDGSLYAGRAMGTSHQVRKLKPSGSPDTSFSGDGFTTIVCHNHETAQLQVDTTGRPLIACLRDLVTSYDFVIWRLTTAGAPDAGYGGGDGMTVFGPAGNDLEAGFRIEVLPDHTVWLATRSAADDSVLDIHTLDGSGNPNGGWGTGVSHTDVGFPFDLNELAVGGGRTWAALQKSATVTALAALVPGAPL